MNRTEALRTLGLDEDATLEDIKVAYKETAQILHPDRFANNKRLQTRATEQFKNLQEAYDYLTKGHGVRTTRSAASDSSAKASSSTKKSSSGKSSSSSKANAHTSSGHGHASRTVEARLAGITAARIQLVKQRDDLSDERRTSIWMIAIGGIVTIITTRRSFSILGFFAIIAAAITIWGIVRIINEQRNINILDEHIETLREEERQLKAQLNNEK